MGDQIIDIILFGLVALFFAYQLWRVLGQRTGAERPPRIPTAAPRVATPAENVVAMPQRALPATPPAFVSLADGLEQIRRADPKFQPRDFVAGARHAFELIVHAFREGDTATLRPLVSDEVFATFADEIQRRQAAGETAEGRVERQETPEITQAHLDGRTAIITVRFVSAQILVTRNAGGTVVEGDPDHPVDRIDLWTFARDTRSGNPNWLLVATSAPE
jgi:predicted lipid-binding transport protein (Tim44 family)